MALTLRFQHYLTGPRGSYRRLRGCNEVYRITRVDNRLFLSRRHTVSADPRPVARTAGTQTVQRLCEQRFESNNASSFIARKTARGDATTTETLNIVEGAMDETALFDSNTTTRATCEKVNTKRAFRARHSFVHSLAISEPRRLDDAFAHHAVLLMKPPPALTFVKINVVSMTHSCEVRFMLTSSVAYTLTLYTRLFVVSNSASVVLYLHV